MSDCISRQAAIDALDEIEAEVADGYGYQYAKWREYFAKMPPAEPEIIRCEECVFYEAEDGWCEMHSGYGFWEKAFCSFAKRREVTT